MTKQTNLKGFFLFLGLLFCISSFAIERPRVPKTNWGNSMGRVDSTMCIEILPDNILIIYFSVAVAVPNIEDYPPLFIEYNWGGYEVGTWGPIMNSDLIPADINNIPGYEAHFTIVIDLDHLCQDDSNTGPTPFSYSFDLVTNNVGGNSNALLYPILDYPDVFPPAMFDELNDPDYTPEYAGGKELCCIDLADGRTEEPSGNEMEVVSDDAINSPSVTIFPNPTNNDLNIGFNSKEENVQIDLIGLDGKVIRTIIREKSISRNYTKKIDMSNLPKGIYFCRINSNSISEIHKVIKL